MSSVAEPDADKPLELDIPGYQYIAHLHRSNDLDAYDVWSEERQCRCVAKMLRPDLQERAEAEQRLLREGRLLKKFTHPHIVRAYEVIVHPEPVVILETLTGETLAYLLAERARRLALEEVAFLGLHLCSAVHYLHRHRLLHLDLKPSNIISDRGFAKLLDLSIARPPGRGRKGVGTFQYMAPEQALGGLLTEKTDVWGIGAVLYEALTGIPPFGTTASPTRLVQLERRADPVRRHRRVPMQLATAVDACLDPEPTLRPKVDDLHAVLDGLVS